MRTVSATVSEKTAELFGIFKQAKNWKLTVDQMATLLEVKRTEAKYLLHCLRRDLRKKDSKYIIAHEPHEGYYLADTSTPEGAKIATRESLKAGRRTIGHSRSSGFYHRKVDPQLVVDSKTAKLYAITSMYDEASRILEGVRNASMKLLAADSEATKEMQKAEGEALSFLDDQKKKFDPDEEQDFDDEHEDE